MRLKVVKTDFKQSLYLAYFISSLRYVDAFRISDKLTDFLLYQQALIMTKTFLLDTHACVHFPDRKT